MRKKEVAFHLDQLERLLIPTQTTKMCLWAMQQDKSFYSPDSAIYNIFCKEIGITEDLSAKMLERRSVCVSHFYAFLCLAMFLLLMRLHYVVIVGFDFMFLCVVLCCRDHMIELTKQLTESLDLIKVLRTAIDDKHRKFDHCCTLVKNVGSAKQQVAFLLWITKNVDKLSHVIPDFWRSLVPGVGEEKEKL